MRTQGPAPPITEPVLAKAALRAGEPGLGERDAVLRQSSRKTCAAACPGEFEKGKKELFESASKARRAREGSSVLCEDR